MGTEDVKDRYEAIREGVISSLVSDYISTTMLEADWDVDSLHNILIADYATNIPIQEEIDGGADVDEILKLILKGLALAHQVKENAIGSETMRTFEKAVMLRALDQHWKDHLAVMDQLRQSVNLRGYGQKNPVQEFKRESFSMFTVLLETINIEMVQALCSLNLEKQPEMNPENLTKKEHPPSVQKKMPSVHRAVSTGQPVKNLKVGRNDPCPCGSGKKYKQCHG
jgi:preprotein translocase subunit SecA